jgi:hypothetical protein
MNAKELIYLVILTKRSNAERIIIESRYLMFSCFVHAMGGVATGLRHKSTSIASGILPKPHHKA